MQFAIAIDFCYYAVLMRNETGPLKSQMKNQELSDALRPECVLTALGTSARGKYLEDYRGRDVVSTPEFAIAILCGAIPLAVGTCIYLCWRITRWSWLPGAGLITIYVGLAMFLTGTIALICYLKRTSSQNQLRPAAITTRGFLAGAVLLVNFPAAAFYALSAISLISQTTVRIVNESGTAMESCIIVGPGVNVEVGPIQAGQTAVRHLDFSGDGTLEFLARQNRVSFDGQLAGYVTGGIGGDVTLLIKPGAEFEVIDRIPEWDD